MQIRNSLAITTLAALLATDLSGCGQRTNTPATGVFTYTAAEPRAGVPSGAAIAAPWTDKTIPATWDPSVSVDAAWDELRRAVVLPASQPLPGDLAEELRSGIRGSFRSGTSERAIEFAARADWISLRIEAWNIAGLVTWFATSGRPGKIDVPATLARNDFATLPSACDERAMLAFSRAILRRLADLHAAEYEPWIQHSAEPGKDDPEVAEARRSSRWLCRHLMHRLLDPWSWTELDEIARTAPDGRMTANERRLLKDHMMMCVEGAWGQHGEATVARMLKWPGWSDEERRDVSRRALRGRYLIGNTGQIGGGCAHDERHFHKLVRADDDIEIEALWHIQHRWEAQGEIHYPALSLLVDRDDCRVVDLLRSLRDAVPSETSGEASEITYARQQLDAALAKAHRAGATNDELLALIESPEGSATSGYGSGDQWRIETARRLLKRGVPAKTICAAFARFGDRFDETLPKGEPWSRPRRSLAVMKGELMYLKIADASLWPDLQRFGPILFGTPD